MRWAWRRFMNCLGLRRDTLLCMRQEDTWQWPDHLGKRTEGLCKKCNALIYFEKQNWPFYKICNRCGMPPHIFEKPK